MKTTRSSLSRMSSRGAYYVIAHGEYQASRKRKPSAIFANIRNPRLALEIARQITQGGGTSGIYMTRKTNSNLSSLEQEIRDLGLIIGYHVVGDDSIVAKIMGDGRISVSATSTFPKGTKVRVMFPQ